MFTDSIISVGVSKILQRSERQEDYTKIIDSFVDTGIIDQILNDNNQIIYGRRGTGKTHLLRVLQQKILDEANTVCIYIDCRNLGSSSQFTDNSKSLQVRCLSLFKDILQFINQDLLEELTANVNDSEIQVKGLDLLSELQSAVVEPKKEYYEGDVVITEEKTTARGARFEIDSNRIGVNASGSKGKKVTSDIKYSIKSEDKIFFPEINIIIQEFLVLIHKKVYIFIDEWAALPYDIQPYLAEMLKRGLIPISNVVIKIASLEYRSNFYYHGPTSNIGLEIGSDITANIDVDDYYVYDRNPVELSRFFSDVLYKHINIDLQENYLYNTYGINNGDSFIKRMFNSQDTFNELVRASEGVIRDLINIFTKAYFEAKKRKLEQIDKPVIVNVSQQWYEQDKERNLSDELKEILSRIIRDVIGEKKARSFLVSKKLESNSYLQQLFDLRVLHIVKRGYSDKANPGDRYNIYTLDYGTYVDLLKTKSKPLDEYQLFEETEELKDDVIVPFDDKRSIRRIVLKEEALNL